MATDFEEKKIVRIHRAMQEWEQSKILKNSNNAERKDTTHAD
jgi:hypothetical protein